MTARRGYSRHHYRTFDYQARLQARLDRRAEDAEYANLLRSARLHQLLHTPDRGPLFELAADLARQEAGHSVKVRPHPLGDRLTLIRGDVA